VFLAGRPIKSWPGIAHELAAQGLAKAEIARRLGVGERSVYRVVAGSAGALR
jgi:hypothetical protein